MPIRTWREQLNNSAMFLFYLPPRVLLTPLDPPWSIFLLWRSWAVRRILVYRVIVSLILAPCRARGLAIAARRSLVIPPESSLHAHKAVLVPARARICDHLPLFTPSNAHRESLRLLSHSSSIYWEICWAYVRWSIFLSLGYNFIDGPMWLGSQWISALWKFRLPSIQRSSGELIPVNVSTPRYFVIWGSNKFESVISSLSVPWIFGVLTRFRFWFQFHTSYLLSFLGYIYGLRL